MTKFGLQEIDTELNGPTVETAHIHATLDTEEPRNTARRKWLCRSGYKKEWHLPEHNNGTGIVSNDNYFTADIYKFMT